MSKILFTDLDDTLLNSEKQLTEENKKALLDMLKEGNKVAFTTGRPLHGAKFLYEQMELPKQGCYIICFQGSLIYDVQEDKILYSGAMESHELTRLLLYLQEKNIYLEAFAKNCFYCFSYTKATERYKTLTQEPYCVVEDINQVIGQPIYKVMAIDYDDQSSLLDLQKEMQEKKLFPFESFFSSPWFYEFCGEQENKGNGLRWLSAYLNIPLENTVAVGDEENDVSMIKAAGIGVAMCNGKNIVKEHADYITSCDHNHSGVAEVIRKFILI